MEAARREKDVASAAARPPARAPSRDPRAASRTRCVAMSARPALEIPARARRRSRAPAPDRQGHAVISAIVPTFRGQARLERNLGSVVAALQAAGQPVGGGGRRRRRRRHPVGRAGRARAGAPRQPGLRPGRQRGRGRSRGASTCWSSTTTCAWSGTASRGCCASSPTRTCSRWCPPSARPLSRCGDEGGKAGEWTAGLVEIQEAASRRGATHALRRGLLLPLSPRRPGASSADTTPSTPRSSGRTSTCRYRAWRRGLRVLHAPGGRLPSRGLGDAARAADARGARPHPLPQSRALPPPQPPGSRQAGRGVRGARGLRAVRRPSAAARRAARGARDARPRAGAPPPAASDEDAILERSRAR